MKKMKSTAIKTNINAGDTDTYTATADSDGGNLNVHLKWGRFFISKNLAIRVSTPQGFVVEADTPKSAAETLTIYGVVKGQYVIEIINRGSRKVRYTLIYGITV